MSLPVDFEEKVRLPAAVGGAGYPYQISAGDLMANFKYLDKFPKSPGDGDLMYYYSGGWTLLKPLSGFGTYVLGSVDGAVQWLETQRCDSESGTP